MTGCAGRKWLMLRWRWPIRAHDLSERLKRDCCQLSIVRAKYRMPSSGREDQTKRQIDRFKEVARALGCDEDEAAFDEKLKGIARQKPKPESREKPED